MFDFEKLEVYQITKSAVTDSLKIMSTNEKLDPYVKDQWKQASLGILLNLAEGAGRMTITDKKHYLTVARSSVFECVALLQVMTDLGTLPAAQSKELYERYEKISKMLLGMIRSHTE